MWVLGPGGRAGSTDLYQRCRESQPDAEDKPEDFCVNYEFETQLTFVLRKRVTMKGRSRVTRSKERRIKQTIDYFSLI